MSQSITSEVIIVGAGIAGLTAAWRLKQAGKQVLVLEAHADVGGRMCSALLEDAIVDYGAQFLSTAYKVIPKLISELKLDHELVTTSQWFALKNNHAKAAILNYSQWWRWWTQSALPFKDFIRLLRKQPALLAPVKHYLTQDFTAWCEFDEINAEQWITKYFSANIARQLTAAIVDGFYFQSLTENSAALIMAVMAFGLHNPQNTALLNGMGSLPKQLAANLNVHCNVAVNRVQQFDDWVEVVADNNCYRARQVIVAVPAPVAKKIIVQPNQTMQPLLETSYSSTINISFLTTEKWQLPARLAKTYGLIVAPNLQNKIAAITIEKNKHAGRVPQGQLINIMLSGQCVKQMLQLTDDELCASIKSELEEILPNIYQYLRAKHIYRWVNALPYSPIGRAKHIKIYRESCGKNNAIWLAGDYLGLPWSDSAAASGEWVAQQIIAVSC